MRKMFKDTVNIFKDGTKNVISVRDGFQEYLGMEIGQKPLDKTFKIYRSPDTIRELTSKLNKIPVTDGHIELEEIPEDKILGYIDGTKLVKYANKDYDTTVAIKNEIKAKDNLIELVNGNNELSLGYFADTVEHKTYDLEQVDIVPHHLAIVEAGRCGTICKFTDERKDMKNKKHFVDSMEEVPADKVKDESSVETTEKESETETIETEEVETKDEETSDAINLAKVSEIVRDLPQAIKLMDIEELTKLVPVLETAINSAKDNMPTETVEEETMEEISDEDMEEEVETLDECSQKKDFSDSIEFKDAVMKFADKRVSIILKAKTFLDEGYDFSKDCKTIMRDSIATQNSEQFKDEELEVAFKMLNKVKDYQNFADAKVSEFDKLKDKEI